MTLCDACAEEELADFADLGDVPAQVGVHWDSHGDAVASPTGRLRLASCPGCGYVRNVAYEPRLVTYDTTVDTTLYHSVAFQQFSVDLVHNLNERYDLSGRLVLDIGCGQGEFLRELCKVSGANGVGYDARYAGEPGNNGATTFHSSLAPRRTGLPKFDFFLSRHWFEQVNDPYDFLVDLREQARGREVFGYLEISDAVANLGGAGWEVVYPRVSYLGAYSLARIVSRAGWTVESTGTLFSGSYRYIEISANRPRAGGHVAHTAEIPSLRARDKQLAAIEGFEERHRVAREQWRDTIARLAADGAKPALWGAGMRGAQFLALVDRDLLLQSVVDLNPRKWGQFLPVTGHRVDAPSALTSLQPKAVIVTNPAYREEVGKSLADLGVTAEILVA
jgi:2-polyprenyl-3-methyl-5-hydroxy-6-metoxy-1,4-benzoquinol methylase